MRQLWREGSQHPWVQSVSQLPHLGMHFQPQLGVLTETFDPCEPSWDQRIRSTLAPLPGVLCQSSIWSGWTRVMGGNLSLWICLFKLQPSSEEQNQITHPFTWEYNTQLLTSVCCAQVTPFPVFSHSTFICYCYAQHCQHWSVLNYLRPAETQIIAYEEIFWKKLRSCIRCPWSLVGLLP